MVSFGEKKIGDGNPVFIVFEAGPTHDSIDSAKELVMLAAKAGADAVKFQILDPGRLVPDRTQLFSYDILINRETGETKTVSEPLYDILQRRHLTFDEWRELKIYCDSLGIEFFSTATFFDEVDFLKELGTDTIKICSGDINHFPLIRYCADTGMSIQLDTGNASIGEVEKAVDEVLKRGNKRIIIHNCPSGYPARIESINLNIIPTLKQMFKVPVAFSDHTPGWEMDIAAIALGANMVEKTITLDRTTPRVEHMFSLEPNDMKKFVQSVRELEAALGNTRRIIGKKERSTGIGARRSIILARDVKQGQFIVMEDLDFARPGRGISPDISDTIAGKSFTRNIQKGDMLLWGDFS